jgi:hypothetical protein
MIETPFEKLQDITENRPALSRWHTDYKAEFDQFLHADDASV